MFNIWMKRGNAHFKKIWNLEYFTLQVMLYPISFATYHFAMNSTGLWATNGLAFQLGHGLQFIYVMLTYQQAMITLEQVNPYCRTVVFSWILLWINLYSIYTSNTEVFDMIELIYFTNAIQFVAICIKVYNVLNELKSICGIRMFHIKYDAEKAAI